MRKNFLTATGVVAAALTLSVATAGSAHASLDSGMSSCNTTGAFGDMAWDNYWGPGYTINLRLTVTDTQADGNGVGVRLLSKDTWGKIHYWPWHKNTKGYGKTGIWDTTASHANGLFDIGIEVARFNSNGTWRNGCTKW